MLYSYSIECEILMQLSLIYVHSTFTAEWVLFIYVLFCFLLFFVVFLGGWGKGYKSILTQLPF